MSRYISCWKTTMILKVQTNQKILKTQNRMLNELNGALVA